jgi:DNA primase
MKPVETSTSATSSPESPGEMWRSYKQEVLDRIGDFSLIFRDLLKRRPSAGQWVSAQCPFHDDRNPSFSFNRVTGAWRCHAGCGAGDVFDYLMRVTGGSFKEVLVELGDQLALRQPRLRRSPPPPIQEDIVARWATALRGREDVRRWLAEQRGLSQETIERYGIGWNARRARITIPIRDENGWVVNVRLYHPTKQPKFLNYTTSEHGYGSPPRLYGLDELDRLLLQQAGFMAVTGTHGATTFRLEWLQFLKGRDLIVIYDCDERGQAAAREIVLPQLKGTGVLSVRNILLPLAGTRQDKDVTDYIHKHGFAAAELKELIRQTEVSFSNPDHDNKRQSCQSHQQNKERKTMPRINFNTVDDVGPLPAGKYLCRLDDVDPKKTQYGDDMWRLRFKVEAGPQKGRVIFDNLVFSNAAMPRVKLLCRCLGIDVSEEVELTPELLCEKVCMVKVEIEEHDDFGERNTVPFDGFDQANSDDVADAAMENQCNTPSQEDIPF